MGRQLWPALVNSCAFIFGAQVSVTHDNTEEAMHVFKKLKGGKVQSGTVSGSWLDSD